MKIMYHRPEKLDCIIADFLAGRKLVDFAPETSEFFEDDRMNE